MTYDERIVFDSNMQSGYRYEVQKKYESALDRYTTAYNIADEANDSAKVDAQSRMLHCMSILDPNSEIMSPSVSSNDDEPFGLDSL